MLEVEFEYKFRGERFTVPLAAAFISITDVLSGERGRVELETGCESCQLWAMGLLAAGSFGKAATCRPLISSHVFTNSNASVNAWA